MNGKEDTTYGRIENSYEHKRNKATCIMFQLFYNSMRMMQYIPAIHMLLYMHHIQYDCTMFCLTYIIIGILLEPDVFVSLKSVTLGVGILCLKCEAIPSPYFHNYGNPEVNVKLIHLLPMRAIQLSVSSTQLMILVLLNRFFV